MDGGTIARVNCVAGLLVMLVMGESEAAYAASPL
jgi:hypothetical protein